MLNVHVVPKRKYEKKLSALQCYELTAFLPAPYQNVGWLTERSISNSFDLDHTCRLSFAIAAVMTGDAVGSPIEINSKKPTFAPHQHRKTNFNQ